MTQGTALPEVLARARRHIADRRSHSEVHVVEAHVREIVATPISVFQVETEQPEGPAAVTFFRVRGRLTAAGPHGAMPRPSIGGLNDG